MQLSGYNVIFKVNGGDYYISSCQQGGSISKPIGNYVWYLSGVPVSFPLTPNSDLILIGEEGKYNVTTPIADSEYSSAYSASKAFDDNLNTRWACRANPESGYLRHIGADFGIDVQVLTVKCARDVTYPQWEHLTLKCSDDGISWANASDYYPNPTYDGRWCTFVSNKYDPHRYWAVFSDNSDTVSEIEFYGITLD